MTGNNASEYDDSDLEAMRRLNAGEDLALNDIMERWKARVITYLLRFTGDEAVAFDLAQETFVRLYQSRQRFCPKSSTDRSFSAWLFGIAANLGRQYLRWHRRHPTVSLEEAAQVTIRGDPAFTAESKEREIAVKSAIGALPDDLREALILSEYEGLTHAEIAKVSGCSVKAIERRLSRARDQIRSGLRRYLSDPG